MAREIPELVRAAAGLAATVLDEARKLPEALPGLPVRLIGLAMQRAMRIQQQYAGFVARGDELFTGIRGEDEPGLATFDDDEPEPVAPSGGFRESAFDRVDDLPPDEGHPEDELIEAQLLEAEVDNARETVEGLAGQAPSTDALLEEVLDDLAIEDLVAQAPDTAIPLESALPATKAAPEKKATPEKKAAPEKKAVKAATPAKKAPAEPAAKKTAPAPTSTSTTTPSLAAPPAAPIDGYDFFSLAQLRGHLRGYAAPTVEQLLAYEKGGLGREPYLRMLRNRLERLRAESA